MGAQVKCDFIRRVQEARKVQPGEVAEGIAGGLLQHVPHQRLGLPLQRFRSREHQFFRGRQHAVEAAKDCQRKDDLAILVAPIWTAEKIADFPDEAG